MDNMMEGYYVWGLKGDLIIEWYSVEQKITSLGIPEHGDHFTKVICPHILPDSHSIEIYNLEEVRGVLKFLGFPIIKPIIINSVVVNNYRFLYFCKPPIT